jgi:hypothetical protein
MKTKTIDELSKLVSALDYFYSQRVVGDVSEIKHKIDAIFIEEKKRKELKKVEYRQNIVKILGIGTPKDLEDIIRRQIEENKQLKEKLSFYKEATNNDRKIISFEHASNVIEEAQNTIGKLLTEKRELKEENERLKLDFKKLEMIKIVNSTLNNLFPKAKIDIDSQLKQAEKEYLDKLGKRPIGELSISHIKDYLNRICKNVTK